jgi:hypothetical protein
LGDTPGGIVATSFARVARLPGLVVVLTIPGYPGWGVEFPIIADFGSGTGIIFILTPPIGIGNRGAVFAGGTAPFPGDTPPVLGKGIVLGLKNWL